jgi:hypothetical protein
MRVIGTRDRPSDGFQPANRHRWASENYPTTRIPTLLLDQWPIFQDSSIPLHRLPGQTQSRMCAFIPPDSEMGKRKRQSRMHLPPPTVICDFRSDFDQTLDETFPLPYMIRDELRITACRPSGLSFLFGKSYALGSLFLFSNFAVTQINRGSDLFT